MNRDKNGEADGMNLEVDSKDEVMHIRRADLHMDPSSNIGITSLVALCSFHTCPKSFNFIDLYVQCYKENNL